MQDAPVPAQVEDAPDQDMPEDGAAEEGDEEEEEDEEEVEAQRVKIVSLRRADDKFEMTSQPFPPKKEMQTVY